MSLTKYASAAERKAATALIDEILRRGYECRIHEGGDWATPLTRDRQVLLDGMASTGHDSVRAYRREGTELKVVAHFSLIYQGATERDEVIYDYSANDEADAIWKIAAGVS